MKKQILDQSFTNGKFGGRLWDHLGNRIRNDLGHQIEIHTIEHLRTQLRDQIGGEIMDIIGHQLMKGDQ